MNAKNRVELTISGDVAGIVIQRPAKLNALTLEMLAEFERLLESLEAQPDIRLLTITGQGKAFSVGADLQQFGEQTPDSTRARWIAAGHRAFARLAAFRRPSLAMVNGPAFGGGLELALACDIRIGATTAQLGLPETGIGTVPGWGGTARLIDAIGATRARELILTGRSLDAETACTWGLLSAVASPDELQDVRDGYLDRLRSTAPVAQELAKAVLNALTGNAAPVQALEALAGSLSITTDDLKEGIAAFKSRRPPEFKGR